MNDPQATGVTSDDPKSRVKSTRGRLRRGLRATVAVAVVASGLTALELGTADVAGAEFSPIAEPGANHVTADALPTVQINGVVWDQEVIGDTVYAVGEFTSARPAGSAAGVNETPRSNILAYNITTGALVTSFNASLNRAGRTITASPDGSRLYVGGSFTSVNGTNRYRIAALNPSTGALVNNFNAIVDYNVNTLVATNDALYVGGAFSYGGSAANLRGRLAAFSSTNGAVLPWNPNANATVQAMTLTPDGSKIIVGGHFTQIGGSNAYGLASIDRSTGALVPWAANQVVRNAGDSSAILSLSTTATSIIGTGYHFGAGGNLEGTFSADPTTGAINWLEDCHGDTYDNFPTNGYVYTVSHKHYCGNVGAFPQSDPWSTNMRHATSFEDKATGTIGREPWGYTNWEGTPSPSMVNWFPDWQIGSYTGQNQATWTVEGNKDYVVAGGEFLRVNNTPQQGLVRFAVRSIAPRRSGPQLSGATFPINVRSTATGEVRVSFPANQDRDDNELTYRIIRDGNSANPVHVAKARSTFWDRPIVGFTDKGLVPGQTYSYRVTAVDRDGNTAQSSTVQVTAATTGAPSPYSDMVMADGARMHWRLGEPSGSTAVDALGPRNANIGSGVTLNQGGAIVGDTNTAASFNGTSNATVVDPTLTDSTDVLTIEAWVRTNSTRGGRIVGFGNRTSGNSSSYDRILYLTNNGRVIFGANAGGTRTLESQTGLNNNPWHHVVGTLGPDGMDLFIDGVRVASRADTRGGQAINGYWRIGADNLSGWPSRPSSDSLTGQIDEVAIYQNVLSAKQIAGHYAASGRTAGVQPTPSDAYGAHVFGADPHVYYRLDESSGTTANDRGVGDRDGAYVGSTQRNRPGVLANNSSTQFSGSGFVSTNHESYNPSNYSAEVWFNTTTNSGGQLIGFGNSRTGLPTVSDRQVSMDNNGRLRFTAGTDASVVSSAAYNDGNWHHAVATQGPDGMRLYVDGVQVGTNDVVLAAAYNGYWRVGGGLTPSTSTDNYFTGRLDEAAVYDRVLQPDQVLETYFAGGGTAPNVVPTAAFTSSAAFLALSVDGSGSSDPDGSIVSHAWNFGDGTTATGATASHTYAAGGTYTVTLTVTDDDGATAVMTHDVTVAPEPPNVVPTAAFTSSAAFLALSVDGSGSSDSDGSIVSHAWNFGDGTTATGATASHTYAAGGTYTVTLTVTDDDGATAQSTKVVNVAPEPPNVAPTAAFTSGSNGLVLSVNGSGSSDSDGSIVSHAWNFGDGTTATGATASHTYAAAGTYTVTLTVTDDDGATAQSTKVVNVIAAAVFADDSFERSSTNGLGSAVIGGEWVTSGTRANFSVSNGKANVLVPSASTSRSATLTSVSAADVESTVDFTLDKDPTGNGVYVGTNVRKVGRNEYLFRVWVHPTNTRIQVLRLANGSEAVLGSTVILPGAAYTPGSVIHVKFQATGTGTTNLNGKVWFDGATEPAAWQIERTDSTAELQGPGGVGVYAYTSGSMANAPVNWGIDNFRTTTPGGGVPPVDPPVDPPNVAPTASFTWSTSFLNLAVNAAASSDPDGTISAYEWDFGDGRTGTGVNAAHSYAAPGTYTVRLRTIDDDGDSSVAQAVVTVVADPGTPIPSIADSFERTVANGWGTADIGGAWTTSGTASNFSVADGKGRMVVPSGGSTREATLNATPLQDVDTTMTLVLDKAPAGGSTFLSGVVRKNGNNDYRVRLYARQDATNLEISRMVNGAVTNLTSQVIPGVVLTPGVPIHLRIRATGSGTTALAAKVWFGADAEPANWFAQTTDSTAVLQSAGGVGIHTYLGGAATNVPLLVTLDDLRVTPAI